MHDFLNVFNPLHLPFRVKKGKGFREAYNIYLCIRLASAADFTVVNKNETKY